jgi:hypothetical protein
MKKLPALLLLLILASGCTLQGEQAGTGTTGPDSTEFSSVMGGILSSQSPDTEAFSSLITSLAEGDPEGYLSDLEVVESLTEPIPASDVVIPGRREDGFYRGLYLNDIRDARYALASIDRIKSAGFDTILLEVQYGVNSSGDVYMPGEEVYLFYINAFQRSGFRLWLAMGHTAYDFPYRHDSKNRIPLESQSELLEMVEPEILRWAGIAETYNVDTFIPSEEANTMLVTGDYDGTDLCQPERDLLSQWMQEILPEIRAMFSGRVGFATNDGGPCERLFEREEWMLEGPDFDYTGYDFVIRKFPFRSVFATDEEWEEMAETSIPDMLYISGRDQTLGLILYETGGSVGRPLDEDFAGSLPVREVDESHQRESYERLFEISDSNPGIRGMFFKISGAQPHEPSWNPFGRPAEDVLRDNFAANDTLGPEPLDSLWASVGEEGIKAIQACLSDEIPFDPEHQLNEMEYMAFFDSARQTCRLG